MSISEGGVAMQRDMKSWIVIVAIAVFMVITAVSCTRESSHLTPAKAREIAETLKAWIEKGTFLLGEPQFTLPSR